MATMHMKLTSEMNVVAEFDSEDKVVYFHAEFNDGERASTGYSSDLLDVVYSYGNFDTEIDAIPVVADMWSDVADWLVSLDVEEVSDEEAREEIEINALEANHEMRAAC